jgi:hypothetical protein
VTRYILIAAVIVGIAAGGWIWVLQRENSRLSSEVDHLSRELQVAEDVAKQAQTARRIAEAQRRVAAQRAAEKDRAVEALLTGDFADADTRIDPRIADFLDCMRRSGGNENGCAGGLGQPAQPGANQ